MARNLEGHKPSWWRKHPEALQKALAALQAKMAPVPPPKRDQFNEVLGLLSLAFTVASWGWTVIAPDSSLWFGSALLFLGVATTLVAIFRVWAIKRVVFVLLSLTTVAAFVFFDLYIVIKPQRGRAFTDLLVEGYHISSECESMPAQTEMPEWMRDQSKNWKTRVGDLINQKLSYKDTQLWEGAIIVGKVSDVNTNQYQCTSLAVKVGALETLVSNHYDSGLKHRNYNGPVYWFDATDGHVDISDAFKNGNTQAGVVINGHVAPPKQPEKK
jgi:hypothetical protein